jgi:hypothetical protein
MLATVNGVPGQWERAEHTGTGLGYRLLTLENP